LKKIAAMRAGDADKATAAADAQANLWRAELAFMTTPIAENGLGMTPEEATKAMRKKFRGQPEGITTRFR
jgi:hypothetical protein